VNRGTNQTDSRRLPNALRLPLISGLLQKQESEGPATLRLSRHSAPYFPQAIPAHGLLRDSHDNSASISGSDEAVRALPATDKSTFRKASAGFVKRHEVGVLISYSRGESMSTRRVLIVDDDINLSRLSGMILENSGQYEVMIVNDSARALPAAVQFRPDVMLLDVDMPGKSGGDLAREAANDLQLRDIPILFLTGLVSHEEAGASPIESGGMRFLAKPVEPAVLLAEVGRLAPPLAAL
jgi:CheY-like chemotaxis protein